MKLSIQHAGVVLLTVSECWAIHSDTRGTCFHVNICELLHSLMRAKTCSYVYVFLSERFMAWHRHNDG